MLALTSWECWWLISLLRSIAKSKSQFLEAVKPWLAVCLELDFDCSLFVFARKSRHFPIWYNDRFHIRPKYRWFARRFLIFWLLIWIFLAPCLWSLESDRSSLRFATFRSLKYHFDESFYLVIIWRLISLTQKCQLVFDLAWWTLTIQSFKSSHQLLRHAVNVHILVKILRLSRIYFHDWAHDFETEHTSCHEFLYVTAFRLCLAKSGKSDPQRV